MKCVDENQGEWYGTHSWGLMEITKIEAPNIFEANDYFSDESGVSNKDMPTQRFYVELIEQGNKTLLVTKSFTETAEQLEELIKMGMVEGFNSQLNKLDALVQA